MLRGRVRSECVLRLDPLLESFQIWEYGEQMGSTISIKLDKTCPVCKRKGVETNVEFNETTVSIDGWLIYWLRCRRGHLFSNNFPIPKGAVLPVIVPGLTGKYQ